MYTMMQVCRELDMTYQTLKFYCNEGLVPNVKRDKITAAFFDEKDVKWIHDLSCLKNKNALVVRFFNTKVMNPFYVFSSKMRRLLSRFTFGTKSLVAIKFNVLISHIRFPYNTCIIVTYVSLSFSKNNHTKKFTRFFCFCPDDQQLQPHCIIDYRNRLKQSRLYHISQQIAIERR